MIESRSTAQVANHMTLIISGRPSAAAGDPVALEHAKRNIRDFFAFITTTELLPSNLRRLSKILRLPPLSIGRENAAPDMDASASLRLPGLDADSATAQPTTDLV